MAGPFVPLPLPWESQESHGIFCVAQVAAEAELLRAQLIESCGRVVGKALAPHSLLAALTPAHPCCFS
jgi:hypothetical protein